jgi:hypothetical protein
MSRTRRTFAAYTTGGDEVLVQHSSSKYDYVGLVNHLDGSGEWKPAAYGCSHASVTKRTRSAARKLLAPNYSDDWAVRAYSCVAQMWEATAPVVRDYFGHHRLRITAVFLDGGWQEVNYHAGRSLLRTLDKEGVQAVQVRGVGSQHRLRERTGLHVADFQMSEVVKSMNARKAAK